MTRSEYVKSYTDFIRCVMRLGEKARREGLLALEDETEDLDDESFKDALRMVVDGIASETINEIYSNLISFEKDEYTRQLKTVQKRAALGIQSGENPRILYLVLKSYANLTPDENSEIERLLLSDDSDDLDLGDEE